MSRYNLLKESDFIPNNHYSSIVYYTYPSSSRKAITDSVYFNKFSDFCGTSKNIDSIVCLSIIPKGHMESCKETILKITNTMTY